MLHMLVGGPAHLNKFQKIMAFRTSEILSFKNNIEQTDSALVRRQNNGDTKTPSKNRCTIIIFPIINYFFTEDIWERTHDDRYGNILLVANKSLIKNR